MTRARFVLGDADLSTFALAVQPRFMRLAAHRIADDIFEKLTGIRGAFATRIAYVTVTGQPPAQRYKLIVADTDGENPRVILESGQPIMSPAWSADGQWLAYVSFENKRSAVYVQKVRFKHVGRQGSAVLEYDIVTGRYAEPWKGLSRVAG